MTTPDTSPFKCRAYKLACEYVATEGDMAGKSTTWISIPYTAIYDGAVGGLPGLTPYEMTSYRQFVQPLVLSAYKSGRQLVGLICFNS